MKPKGNSIALGDYAVPLLLCLTIFLQVSLFQWFCYHNLLITSLWKAPAHFLVFWLSKIGIALFLASFSLLFKRKWWTVALVAVVSLWSLSNLIYYRANNLLLSVAAIFMADNLNGFQSSILAYWNWQSTVLVLIPIIYSLILIPLQAPSRRKPVLFAVLLLLVAIGDIGQRYLYNRFYDDAISKKLSKYDIFPYLYYGYVLKITNYLNRLSPENEEKLGDTDKYVMYHSILANIPQICVYHAIYYSTNKSSDQMRLSNVQLPDEVTSLLSPSSDTTCAQPHNNVIVILVESLESWAIDATTDQGKPVAPYLAQLKMKGVYAPHIKSQVREGVSGDGQLIVNTGLLPLRQGVACMLYGENTYPNIAGRFHTSATLIPTPPNMWNQLVATLSYGYRKTMSPPVGEVQDNGLFMMSKQWIDTASQPFCCQLLTISTHSPFSRITYRPLHFDSDLPSNLRDYLNCVHYADSCIGDFMEYLERKGMMDNTIVVITGDHTIFKSNMLREYQKAAAKRNYGLQSGHNFVPLIILTPSAEPTTLADTCGQMDIYPTLRCLIGEELYPWKGFGRNLLDATSQRPLPEAEAYHWSDMMIRSDWFSSRTE
ncbi:MAG: sulfatase-like hydrolase/transferase [Bacteroidales bacterium]|nr:sulfatase-like hydrolase/transferase [Bacteroidales bacterium]